MSIGSFTPSRQLGSFSRRKQVWTFSVLDENKFGLFSVLGDQIRLHNVPCMIDCSIHMYKRNKQLSELQSCIVNQHLKINHSIAILYCRQTTDLDKECEKPDKKTKKPLGCRVFGDCDRLMQNVMSHILSAEQLKEWEEARPARMKEYDSHREQVN